MPVLDERPSYKTLRARNKQLWQAIFGEKLLSTSEVFRRLADAVTRSRYDEMLELTLHAEKIACENYLRLHPLRDGQWALTTNGEVKIFDLRADAEKERFTLMMTEEPHMVTECIPPAIFMFSSSKLQVGKVRAA